MPVGYHSSCKLASAAAPLRRRYTSPSGYAGAFNHTVGLQRAGIIVAINQNRRATIFRSADFGVVGTWQEFLPPLIEELRPMLAELAS